MPQVNKQPSRPHGRTATAAPSTTTGPIDDDLAVLIRDVRDPRLNRLKVAVYGDPKTGKTRLACTFPKPLLVLGLEDGTASVAGLPGVQIADVKRTQDFDRLVSGPVAAGRWKTVVVDHATKMRELRIAELFASMGVEPPEKKPFLFADNLWKQVWNQAAADVRKLLTPLFDLVERMPLNVVVIAQQQFYGGADDSPVSAAPGEAIKPAIGPAMGKTLAMWLAAECDYTCNTLIRQGYVEKTEDWEGEKVTQKVPTGKKEFCLRVGPHDIYVTGFRQAYGAPELPEVIVDPSYDKIVRLIQPKTK